jgi:hypothetical protein
MVLLQNYTKEYNSELKMLDFIVNHRKEKSVKRAFYTSYKNAIKCKYYNPHSDFVFARTIDDPNILEKLLSLELKVKQSLFTDANYLEGMALLKFLKEHYTEKQIAKLFVQELSLYKKKRQYWEDILRMIQKDNAFSELEQYFFKHKLTVENLHDEIIRVLHIAEFSSWNNSVFHYEKSLLMTQGKYDDMIFKLPVSAYELSLWSKLLHNCMFAYAENIERGSSIIFAVFKKEKLCYALELSEGKIMQAKAVSNQSIPQEDMKRIRAWYQKYLTYLP